MAETVTRITGNIDIDFDVTNLNDKSLDKFKKKMNELMLDFETMMFDAASESGFEIDAVHPALLDEIYDNKY